MPIQQMLLGAGGPGERGNFSTYKMFAPKGSIATSNMTGAGRSGVVVYPCKASITENADFNNETGTTLTASTFFDSPTPTIAAAFGIASNVSTSVNVVVRDDSYDFPWDPENYNAYSTNRYDVITDWDDLPQIYDPSNGEAGGVGVNITGFWKTDTDSLGKWKTSVSSGIYAQPSRTSPDSGSNEQWHYGPSGNASDAATDEDNANTGCRWTAGSSAYAPTTKANLANPNLYFAQFVFNSGLGSAKGFVIQGWNDSYWITNGKGADGQGHVFIIDVFETPT
tara:strand:- start:34 stop:876 length:843 start_codon:yes stop_codon:yes gene_type:complete